MEGLEQRHSLHATKRARTWTDVPFHDYLLGSPICMGFHHGKDVINNSSGHNLFHKYHFVIYCDIFVIQYIVIYL